MSQALAEAGARVVLTGRTRPRVQDAATRIAPGATGLIMDVRDEQSVSAGVEGALTILGGIDVLVNNAGIGMRTVNPDFMTEPIGFWQVSPDGFRDLLATNVLGYFLVARAVVPHMLEAGHGKIANISVSETTILEGIRTLVTGGTSGLGFAMSQALAEAGARVVLTGRTEQRVQDAATRIAPGATGLIMDVRDEQSVSAGVERALTILGGIDVLVNNAGIGMRTVNPDFMTEPIGFWQVSPDGFRDLLTTNVVGYFLVARAVVPHMLEAGHGKIVNISVSETTMRRKGFTPYGPSRAATEALSHIMAADLAGTGIDVNLLLPGGATRSGMTPDSAPEDMQATWLDPAIMGPPVVWLASPASDGLTDQRIIATEFAVP